jgi:hypothetical protein
LLPDVLPDSEAARPGVGFADGRFPERLLFATGQKQQQKKRKPEIQAAGASKRL